LADVPCDPTGDPGVYCWKNDFWNNADALVQYGLVRSRQPRRVIEIGCGWSSLLLAKALGRNEVPCKVVQIEPHPNAEIFRRLPSHWVHHQCILQRAPMEIFERLDAGDILFYDGSHCAKVASDVTWFFFRILPRLKSGVLIHIHDIFLPYDYPEQWIFERGQTWNEQYVLQAFLMHNSAYKIVIANRYLFSHHGRELDDLYRGVQPSYGVSFWMQKS
jgi:predicted O-methyltransferase YrrM